MKLLRQRIGVAILVTLVVFFGTSLILWGRYSLDGEERGPRLSIPSCPLDLGSGDPGDTLSNNFTVANLGDAPLEFSATAGYGCTDLVPASGTIRPGRELSIAVSVRLDSPGSNRDISVRFRSNDQTQSDDAVVRVLAECPYPFEVQPNRVDFGQVARGKTRSEEISVRLRYSSGTASQSKDDDIVASVADEALLVEELGSKGNTSVFRITLRKTTPNGSFQSVLKLQSPDSTSWMNVPITAYIADEIVFAPTTLTMVDDMPPRPASFFVWRPDRKPLGHPLSIIAPSGYRVTYETGQALHRCRFTLVRDGEQNFTDAEVQSVRVRFDHKLKVEVPIRSSRPVKSLITEGVEND